MDNLTHTLVGLAAAKAGLERLSPGATAVCLIAANAPDADIVAAFGGSWFYLKHHRGITHSIVGTLAIALLIPLLFYAGERIIARFRSESAPRVRLRGLFIVSLLLSASHPLMDWTNNYGVRPLLPWSGQWFYGDLVYIIDPWLWLSLGGASFLLTATAAAARWRTVAWGLLALLAMLAFVILPLRVGMEYPLASRALWLAGLVALIVAHRMKLASRWGSSIAVAALVFVIVYWCVLGVMHGRALKQAQAIAAIQAERRGETVLRVAATPTLADPSNWRAIAETNRAAYRFDTSLLAKTEAEINASAQLARFEKPQGTAAEHAARAAQDERAVIFLDFARFPAVRVETQSCAEELLVQFADLRFTEPDAARRGGNFTLEVPLRPAR